MELKTIDENRHDHLGLPPELTPTTYYNPQALQRGSPLWSRRQSGVIVVAQLEHISGTAGPLSSIFQFPFMCAFKYLGRGTLCSFQLNKREKDPCIRPCVCVYMHCALLTRVHKHYKGDCLSMIDARSELRLTHSCYRLGPGLRRACS